MNSLLAPFSFEVPIFHKNGFPGTSKKVQSHVICVTDHRLIPPFSPGDQFLCVKFSNWILMNMKNNI